MYKYQETKPLLFNEENQENFLEFRDEVKKLIQKNNYFTSIELQSKNPFMDGYLRLAAFDRLIEIKEIEELQLVKGGLNYDNRIFRKTQEL